MTIEAMSEGTVLRRFGNAVVPDFALTARRHDDLPDVFRFYVIQGFSATDQSARAAPLFLLGRRWGVGLVGTGL